MKCSFCGQKTDSVWIARGQYNEVVAEVCDECMSQSVMRDV